MFERNACIPIVFRGVFVFWIMLIWLGSPLDLFAHTSKCVSSDHDRPNIVLIMVDDLGWADLGCYGSKAVRTPRIDQLAMQGMRFTQAYSGSVVCAPARCTLMTGKHSGHCSVRVNTGGVPLLPEDVTIAEVLQQVGYRCGGFGKWALGDIGTSGAPERQGFDRFFGYYHQYHAHLMYPDYLVDTGKKISYPNNRGFHLPFQATKFPARFVAEVNPETQQPLTYGPYEVVDETLDFIRQHRDQPFFCYASWTPPHGRRMIPESDRACQHYKKNKDWSDEAKVVASMITMMDRHVGQVLDLLTELELDEKTVVVFCSDHGAALRLDGELDSCGVLRGKKRTVYEGGLRIPLIARWPNQIEAGTTSQHICYLGDLMTTLAEFGNCGPERRPANLDSVSFVPTLLGRSDRQENHELLYWDWRRFNCENGLFGDRMTAIRQGDWKLLRNSRDEPWQLYNLRADCAEANDLASQKPKLVNRLIREIDQASIANRQQIEPEKPGDRRFR